MGSNLRRQLREALPPSIKGLQRAVALEIADDARYDDAGNYDPENGRRSKARLADIVRWTAAKDELSVREMLRRLSLAGWEFRVPIGKDKNGNVMYAVPGRAMTFRVPDFEGPTTVGPYVETETEGPTVVGGRANPGWAMAQPWLGEGPTVVGAGPTTVGPPSPISSFSSKESPSTSPVAEDVEETSAAPADADADGGGGGGNPFQEEINKQCERVDAFISTLDFRGKAPNKKQRLQLGQRIMVAFAAGWTERGLTRYLDISDATDVRSAAALYLHRLDDENLPDAGAAAAVAAGLPPVGPDCFHDPAAATDPKHRVDPITGEPCPTCHPDALKGIKAGLPPVCDSCVRANPAARTNIRFRSRVIDHVHQACPDCHPTRIAFLEQYARQDTADGGMRDRAQARRGARADSHTADDYASSSVDDLFAPRAEPLKGTDARVQGWYDVGRQLAAEEAAKAGPQPQIARGGYQPYQDPEDQSVYDKPL